MSLSTKMRVATVFFVAIVLISMVEVFETRGSGGGGRSGGSRSSRTSYSLKRSNSKPKITKYTPINATSACSPVIVSQTKLGSCSSAFNFFAYAVHRYEFSGAPVYWQGYPMYWS